MAVLDSLSVGQSMLLGVNSIRSQYDGLETRNQDNQRS